ncbi:aldehyde dehydrogenase family protein [Chitinophaga silvisoli]|uniref:aldehyde dehydrogenase (NAD(+)) n=1 Tax=Chitinophaga silvisoli TaxID=2291814 RepID=A0A3E1NSW5_9BACT|nr:aldehyde dehydrogenase family protein [Chitinophaga silvisoli]RFM31031.1 aldehyde dehydrogenase family protein [Chitinophaga silvisoli]
MKTIDKIYINGAFVTPHGQEMFDLINPATNQLIGQVRLGDETDAQLAIASAKEAFKTFSLSSKETRIQYLQQLYDALYKRIDDLTAATIEEYGAPVSRAKASTEMALDAFLHAQEVLADFEFERTAGRSRVRMEPLGVVGIITPWNANANFICGKLATAISAGCTAVIKPSEMSALQTQIVLEAFHEAGLPAGIYNVVNGLGNVVGAELTRHPDVAKISFTGSTAVGKTIARGAVDTMKRVTLELGGKSPNIILDDADFTKAIPMAVAAGFMNNGQACIAGTRLLVPETRLDEAKALLKEAVANAKVGDPADDSTVIGPMVSVKQYERVQSYIQSGIEQGAEVLAGGPGHPEGLEAGNFVKPTVFANVTPDMKIAREEIFGPVISVLTYKTEEEAIAMANDTTYGLAAYVSGTNEERARKVAEQIVAGRVMVNSLQHDPMAPFGGFKQSGIGREYGTFGLEEYVEPKTIIRG